MRSISATRIMDLCTLKIQKMMKTIEEQAREYADFECPPSQEIIPGEGGYVGGWEDGCNSGMRDGFIAGYKAATRWIPVEEELPTNQDTVLLCGKGGNGGMDYCTGYFHGPKSGFIDHSPWGMIYKPTGSPSHPYRKSKTITLSRPKSCVPRGRSVGRDGVISKH